MNAYFEIAQDSLEWLAAKPNAELVLLAALPLVWYIVQLRVLSVIALGVIAGAIALLREDVGELIVAIALLSLGGVIVAIDVGLTRRRLKRVENLLNAATQSVRALEVAEERRQAFTSRQQTSHSINSEDRGVAAAEEKLADEATTH